MDYIDRIVDDELARRLGASGAVVIEGPKACGKTATARRFAASEVLLDVDENARRAAALEPALVLSGATPRLIDEWQIEPTIWNHVRRQVDDRRLPGQFILTGSAVPADDITRHTGAGRLTRLRMRPMSLYEVGQSSGATSLAALLDGEHVPGSSTGIDIAALAELVARGGWPGLVGSSLETALQANRDYLDEIRRVDIGRVDGKARDPVGVGRFLLSFARSVATETSVRTMAADTAGTDGSLQTNTALEYLDALGRLMIVEDQPAWSTHLRSRSMLRKTPKRHFTDPSLAVAAVRATSERLLDDLNWLGFLFESLVIRDLRIYAQAADGLVFHYRDNTGLEVDAVVQAGDGRWGAFEVKLGPRQVDDAATSLLKFADRVDTKKVGVPSVLGVVIPSGTGYRREDGVAVIPVSTLGP